MPAYYPALIRQLFKQNKSLLAPHPNIYYGKYPLKKQKKYSLFEMAALRITKLSRDIFMQHRKRYKTMLNRVHANHKVIDSVNVAIIS